jgi:cyclopropane fatty-acyl-phospholipid synthase-like methyltransferase
MQSLACACSSARKSALERLREAGTSRIFSKRKLHMTTAQDELKAQLKTRLFEIISGQIELIAHVQDDIPKFLGNFRLDAEALDEPLYDKDTLDRTENAAGTDGGQGGADRNDIAAQLNRHYDRVFYSEDEVTGMLLGDTEYRNLGYWNTQTTDPNMASERLQDALLDFIPEKKGRILDVACGMGASTRRLLNHYPADNVWAINISEKQIESTRRNAPGCHASVMNAVEMNFEDDFFENIQCIEAAFHFETRRKFLEDAYRILKRGGRLVLSDILYTSAERLQQYTILPSAENHLASVEEYRALLAAVGFSEIIIQDVSKEVWGGHFVHAMKLVHEKFFEGKLNVLQLTEILWTYYHVDAVTEKCLFVSARKL